MIEKRKAIKQLEIDKINIFNRTTIRIYETEIQRQLNLESIVQNTINQLDEKSKPENISKDWLNYFISTSQDVSEDELKKLWAKILAEECLAKNSFSKMTLDKLKVMTADDCKLFENLCLRVINTKNNSIIIKISENTSFKDSYNFDFSSFIHLCDLGLLNNSEIANICIPVKSDLEIVLPDGTINFIENRSSTDYQLKFYLLTSAGKELKRILKIGRDEIYFSNLTTSLRKKNMEIVSMIRPNNMFLHDNVD
ncbi:DUF2806 domain-containing protein [Flavobacterium branchiophilum]